MFGPNSHFIVGLEADADGSLRVYVDQRGTNLHSHIRDADGQESARRAWAGAMDHLMTDIPPTALCWCAPPPPVPRPVASDAADGPSWSSNHS